jgi:hypothetical protein
MSDSVEILAQYQTTRQRALWTGYKRIFQLTRSAALTTDPGTFERTNTFPYKEISKLMPDDKKADEFTFDAEGRERHEQSYPARVQICQHFRHWKR